ncbi:MAG: hypothetical protein A3F10_02510 [Coxiella sp. RIFCSPHIGHO2_12_FULL_42_15]|nr:MAG: hypothetical protein A3F10_02510 [Coxiella sp. RIFCSPHIGHO2_12_FULL_42_15]
MTRPSESKRLQQWLLPLLIIAVIIAIIYAAIRDNFHVVVNNQVYRSAQLPESTLKMLVHLKGIKTIVNLRGANLNEDWYMQEIKTANLLQVKHFDLALKSRKLPNMAELKSLTDIIQTAPKPILLHCLSGSDRTGFASAMSMILLENAPLEKAEGQFSWRYFVTSDKTIGKQVFTLYQQWLAAYHKKNDKTNFLKWVQSAHPLG